jgi:hypothetical protein
VARRAGARRLLAALREAVPWPAGRRAAAAEADLDAWLGTEPGLRLRLAHRKETLARMETLNAPDSLLARQREMVAETEAKLREVTGDA